MNFLRLFINYLCNFLFERFSICMAGQLPLYWRIRRKSKGVKSGEFLELPRTSVGGRDRVEIVTRKNFGS
jgi:hypothetical protein